MSKDRDWQWYWEKDPDWAKSSANNNGLGGLKEAGDETDSPATARSTESWVPAKSLTSYYRETVRFLTIAGKEYAAAHPDTARYLDRDNLETVWPGFEDILRGLGFLGARIHALLDRTRDDFYADLVQLFRPQLAVEVPSVTLTAFSPVLKKLTKTIAVPRGTLLTSGAKETDLCTFSTTQEVRVSPIVLTGIEKESAGPNSSELTLRFSLREGLRWSDLRLDPLRVHLVGELPVTVALHELITRHCTGVSFTNNENGKGPFVGGSEIVTPGGMGPDEPLLPPDRRSDFALSYLTEYFVFREKFLCFDLRGLNGGTFAEGECAPSRISATFVFDCGFPKDKPFDVSNFRLFCTPAVNLFKRSIEPIAARLTYDEYPLAADHASAASAVPHSVIAVTGYDRAAGRRVDYERMTSFTAAFTGAPTWLLRYRSYADRLRRDAILCLRGRQPAKGSPPDGENISVEAWCSNGDLPHSKLHEGDSADCGTLPAGCISATYLTRPTGRAFPRDDLPLAVLSNQLGACYGELAGADLFSAFLEAHDRSGSEGHRRRTGSIKEVKRTKTATSFKGTRLHGFRYTVAIDESAFSDLNDLHLFGQTIAVFLSLWSRMETFTELLFVCRPSGRTLSWSSLENWIQSIDGKAPTLPESPVVPVPFGSKHQAADLAPSDAGDRSPSESGGELEALMEKIEREARSLDFSGAIRLIEGFHAAHGNADPFASGRLLLAPDTSFSFPSSDIVSIERHNDRFLVRCAFMGLAGASSPLPVQWSQIIVEKPDKAAALLALLTVFNNRFYTLFYAANNKYRLDPLPGRYERDPLLRRIAAFGGMLPEPGFSPGEFQSLSYIPLFGASPRSATGLAAIIATRLGNIPVSIQRFMPVRDSIPLFQRTQLGRRNCMLGADTLLGDLADSCAGKFRITCGPVPRSLFESILSVGYKDSRLKTLVETYIPGTSDYDLELLVRHSDLPPAALGGEGSPGARLGINAGLGAPADPLIPNRVIIEGRTCGGEKRDVLDITHTGRRAPAGRTIDKYYEEDLRSLHESARSFSSAFPGAGKELSLHSIGAGDPAVARLFQGAAFLSARVREVLDDTLPGLSERLFDAEWPEFLYAIPSSTIVAFTPRKGSVSETWVLPRGTEILSRTLSKSNERIAFTTSQEVSFNPIVLESADFGADARGKGRVELRFRLETGITWSRVRLDPLRLYLHDEEEVALALHRMFLHDAEKVAIRYDEGGPGKEVHFDDALRFPFCGPEYRLLHPHTFKSTGHASMIEYYAYRPKFLFIDLHGFHDERFTGLRNAPGSCTVTVYFKNDFPQGLSFGKECFRLFCSPAVNLLKRNAALSPTGIAKEEYFVKTAGTLAPHSVHVVSLPAKSGEGPPEADAWEPRFRQGPDGRRSLLLARLSRVSRDGGLDAAAPQTIPTINASAYFTNGTVPHAELSAGDIVFHSTGFPDRIDFVNLTKPTLPALPPQGEKQWHFMALAGAVPAAIPLNMHRLKELLKLFDWRDDGGASGIQNAVVDFNATVVKWVKGGEILRGMEYTISIDESLPAKTNDRHLFGQAFCEFLRSKTPATSFVSLIIEARPSGKILKWERAAGSFGITE